MKDFLITSGYNFDGYEIQDYIEFCSGECALGTGFLSSLGAGFADLTGTNSLSYSEKLNEARNIALEQLIQRAKSAGANAIIGVTLNYTAFSADIMGVVSNGTAVKIKQIKDIAKQTFQVLAFNPDIPVRPIEVIVSMDYSNIYVSLKVCDIISNNIDLLDVTLTFVNRFTDEIECGNLYFSEFEKDDKGKVSQPVMLKQSLPDISIIKDVKVKINRYVDVNGNSITVEGDTVTMKEYYESNNISPSDTANKFLTLIQPMKATTEIYDFALKFNEVNHGFIDSELLDMMQKQIVLERMYGAKPDKFILQIEEYFKHKDYL